MTEQIDMNEVREKIPFDWDTVYSAGIISNMSKVVGQHQYGKWLEVLTKDCTYWFKDIIAGHWKLYLVGHTKAQLALIQPLIELAKKQIREEMYKQLREVEDGLIVRAKQEVIGEIKTDVNYEQLEARRLCGEAIADTDNPNKYPNAQYHLGYEHACRNIIESIKSRYLGNKGGGE